MALKKLPAKRSRKDAAGKGSSTAPQERQVQLKDREYTEFQEEIARRQWTQLVSPMDKYDPEIIMEFYANEWPTEEGVRDQRSWVRGQWIPFDEDAINQFLGHPLVLEEGQHWQDFAWSMAGRRVRIMCTSMTTLTQIWMTLLLKNIFPSSHNSDLPLQKCQLVYTILTQAGARLGAAAARGGPAAASHRCTIAPSRGDTVPGVHLRSPAEAIAPDVQQSQDTSPFPWPTAEQFKATVAWPGDALDFETRVGPAEVPGDDDGAQEDDDMADVLDFFT
ncbi:hypothetical protein HKD37_14G039714 [Glycine soja]